MHRFFLHTQLRIGGKDLPISPYLHTLDCEDFEAFDYLVADEVAYQPLLIDRLGLVRGLILIADKLINVRAYSQADGKMVLGSDGILVLWDTHLRTQTAPVVEIQITDGATRVSGIAIGDALEEA